MASLNSLPDNIILDILRYLPPKDLCLSGRVSRRWRRIVRDNTLWRHVDLTPYKLDLSKMWKVLRTHLSECLISMKIKGYAKSAGPKQKKHSVSNAMMDDLCERCPNIKTLYLCECNTDNLDCRKLPITLTSLAICNSTWQPGWFKIDDAKSSIIHNLRTLNLSGSSRVDNFDVEDLIQWPELEELILNGCYRIGENGLTSIALNLTKLKRLEVSETAITELSIHHICRHLEKLEILNLSSCKNVNDSFLAEIISGLNSIRVLNISDCEQITPAGIKSLHNQESLKTLILKK